MDFIRDAFVKKTTRRMSMMPFLPRIMPPSRKVVMEFRMVNKPHGYSWKDVHQIGDPHFQPAKGDDDEMELEPKDMEVTCQLSHDDTIKQHVDASFLRKAKGHTVYFALDFNGKPDDPLVMLTVIQPKLHMEILFRTHFFASRDITETSPGKTDSAFRSPSASIPFSVPPQDASAAADEVSTSKARIPKEERSNLLAALALESENTKRTDKQTIGPDGGELKLDRYGVHMTIPAGALNDDQEIIMKLLGSPPEPTIQEGEMLASFGVQLNPCGLKFKKPVQIRLPHCAKLASTSPIKMVLYHSRDGKLTTVDMVSQDLRNTPAVVVQERDFVLHIGEFCDICAVFKDGFLGKDVRCVISSRPCSGSKYHDLKITLADDIPNENSITDGYKQICGHQCTRFYVQLHIADVSIALFDNISEKCTESLTEKQIFRRTQNDTYFPEIDTDSFTKLQVRLFHGERANITCSKPGELVREQPTPEPHCANISAQKLNDDQLMKVSKKISHGKYNELSVQLGCSLISANKILVKHGQDYEKALLEVLMKWNQQTTCDHMNQLIKALEKAGVAGQISEIFPD